MWLFSYYFTNANTVILGLHLWSCTQGNTIQHILMKYVTKKYNDLFYIAWSGKRYLINFIKTKARCIKYLKGRSYCIFNLCYNTYWGKFYNKKWKRKKNLKPHRASYEVPQPQSLCCIYIFLQYLGERVKLLPSVARADVTK